MPENIGYQFNRLYASPIETYRQVNTITQRNAIPPEIRWEGMECYVVTENQDYQLVGGLDNSNWVVSGDSPINPTTHFKGFFNATTLTPPINNINGIEGDEYKVTDADSGVEVDFGAGDVLVKTGDILIFYQSEWMVKVSDSDAETSWGEIEGNISDQTDLQGALDLKADVTDVVTLTTDQSIVGTKTFNTGNTSSNIISLNSTNSTTGGIRSENSSGGAGVYNNNTGAGYGVYGNNVSNGIGVYVVNHSTGKGVVVSSGTTGTGNNYEGRNNTTTTFTVTKEGNVTANSFVKSGGTSSEFLKADGSTDSETYLPSSSYTASDVLDKIKTVDGSGSGLDADLLRGVHWGNVNTAIISNSDITGRDIFSSRDGVGIVEIVGISTGCVVGTDTNHDLLLRRNNTERARLTSVGLSVNGTLIGNSTASFSSSVTTGVFTVATLPTGAKGARAFVSDANDTTFNSVVVGGGANNVPVFHDGTTWRIG